MSSNAQSQTPKRETRRQAASLAQVEDKPAKATRENSRISRSSARHKAKAISDVEMESGPIPNSEK